MDLILQAIKSLFRKLESKIEDFTSKHYTKEQVDDKLAHLDISGGESDLVIDLGLGNQPSVADPQSLYNEIQTAIEEKRGVRVYFNDYCYTSYNQVEESDGVVVVFSIVYENGIHYLRFHPSSIEYSYKPIGYGTFIGATSSENGYRGLVPAPIAGEHNCVLHGDGEWKEINFPDESDIILMVVGTSVDSLVLSEYGGNIPENTRELIGKGKVDVRIILDKNLDEIGDESITVADVIWYSYTEVRAHANLVTEDGLISIMININLEYATVELVHKTEYKSVSQDEFDKTIKTYILKEGETIGDAPEWADEVIDLFNDPESGEVDSTTNHLSEKDLLSDATIKEQYYINSSKNLTISSSWRCYIVNVENVYSIKQFKLHSIDQSFYAIAFYSSENVSADTFISGVTFSDMISGQMVGKNIVVPENAVVAVISNRKATSEIAECTGLINTMDYLDEIVNQITNLENKFTKFDNALATIIGSGVIV